MLFYFIGGDKSVKYIKQVIVTFQITATGIMFLFYRGQSTIRIKIIH